MIKDMIFDDGKAVETVLLVSPKDFNRHKLEETYIRPLSKMGVPPNTILAVQLDMPKGKATAPQARAFLERLQAPLTTIGIKRLICTQAPYFKVLAKVNKVTNTWGRAFESTWDLPVFYSPSAAQFYFDPAVGQNIEMTLAAVSRQISGDQVENFEDLTKRSHPLHLETEIVQKWQEAIHWPRIHLDIETTGLRLGAKILTIGISPNEEEAFAYRTMDCHSLVRYLTKYKGELVMHNCTFDAKHLIWNYWMEHSNDIKGLLQGLDTLFFNMQDTRILAYLSLNNTAKADLSLKTLSYEFAGNYAEEIDFVENEEELSIEGMQKLLVYNGIDCLATSYVYDKYRETVRKDQESVYQNVFMPSLKVITQMEMIGVPLNFAAVLKAEEKLTAIQDEARKAITDHPVTQEALKRIHELECVKANAKLKKLVKTPEDFVAIEFNPRSPNHLRILLYEILGMEIKKTTDTNLPSTNAAALKQMHDFLEHNNDPRLDLLEAIQKHQGIAIINSTFIPAMLNKSIFKSDGWRYMFGNFNLGGTVSGRLSSSDPNLQNMPSTGTEYAYPLKGCIQAPPGWIIVGADYFSLEDRISALQTKDPNKLAVYLHGFDGHCLRAYSYFMDQMPDITEELKASPEKEVEIINSIKGRYPALRQLSKGPTFALTYMGTWKTLVENFGLSKAEAQKIEKEYHKLYAVSDAWVTGQLRKAQQVGFVELAFGLRLRTPSLPHCLDIGQKDKLPFEAYTEMKTAANALGQSYGLLNNYSANLFMEKVWKSKYRESILPIMQIHDSQYYMIRNNLGCLKFVNDNLVEAMEWNHLPAIEHDEVGLGSSVEVFWPSLADPMEIPNGASVEEIHQLLTDQIASRE